MLLFCPVQAGLNLKRFRLQERKGIDLNCIREISTTICSRTVIAPPELVDLTRMIFPVSLERIVHVGGTDQL